VHDLEVVRERRFAQDEQRQREVADPVALRTDLADAQPGGSEPAVPAVDRLGEQLFNTNSFDPLPIVRRIFA
jgi:hypothetical protein